MLDSMLRQGMLDHVLHALRVCFLLPAVVQASTSAILVQWGSIQAMGLPVAHSVQLAKPTMTSMRPRHARSVGVVRLLDVVRQHVSSAFRVKWMSMVMHRHRVSHARWVSIGKLRAAWMVPCVSHVQQGVQMPTVTARLDVWSVL